MKRARRPWAFITSERWVLALGCVALSVGAIVLLSERRSPSAHLTHDRVQVTRSAAQDRFTGPALSGELGLSQTGLLAHGTRRVLAEVRVSAAEGAQRANERQAVAMAIVLDVSGSMEGEKIQQAKGALKELVRRMADEDYVAIVTYNDTPTVFQSLARVGGLRRELNGRISEIAAFGGTMIPLALEEGTNALDGAPAHLVRRVVLLSDGLDTSGQPQELVASKIRTRANSGVSTSSLGIGVDYDERFLTAVADAGRGNYEFVQGNGRLGEFVGRELAQASATVVDSVEAQVTLPAGMRVKTVIGAEANDHEGVLRIVFGSISAGETRRAVLDLEVDAGSPGRIGSIATRFAYRTVSDRRRHQIDTMGVQVMAVATSAEAAASRDKRIYGSAWTVVIEQDQKQALESWRAGDVQGAQRRLAANVAHLEAVAREAPGEADPMIGLGDLRKDFRMMAEAAPGSEAGQAYGLERRANLRARGRRVSP